MNADWIEITWSLIAATGLVVSALGVHTAQMQVWFAQGSGVNGPRMLVARAVRRRESLRAVVQIMFLSAGVGAMTRPPAPEAMTTGRGVIIAMLCIGSLLTVANSIFDRRDAAALRRYLETHPEGTPT